MTPEPCRRFPRDLLQRPKIRQPQRLLAPLLASLLWSGAAGAQLSQDLAISVAPTPATVDDPLVVTVTGDASCPRLLEPFIGEGTVDVGYSGQCAVLPPDPGPFTLFSLLDPLSPGIWEIRLVNHDLPQSPPAVVDVVEVSVTDPTFSVQLMPTPATENDEVVARVTGVGSDVILGPPEIEPGRIRLSANECGICDPPSLPMAFQLDQSLGRLDSGEYVVELFFNNQRVAETSLQVLPGVACLPGATTLCLNGGRFRVEATWTTPDGLSGPGMAVEETADTGLFWFFSPNNIEMVVKVLDACATELGTFWVFAGGLTDVGVVLEVTDTEADITVRYDNLVGRRFETVADTAAFATCP